MQPKVFTQTRKVVDADIDDLHHVNNLKYIEWVLEVSEKHWHSETSKSHREKFGWVVMEQHIYYKKAAYLGDEILLKTWIDSVDGAKSLRKIQVFAKESQQLILEAETLWCFVELPRLRPLRIPKEVVAPFFESV